jgi:hypothetical protein
MDLTLVLNLSEPDPALRRVTSVSDLTALDLPPLVQGDTINGTLYLVTGANTYHAASGSADYNLVLEFGRKGEAAVAVSTDVATATNGWTFKLALTSTELAAALAAKRSGYMLKATIVEVADNDETTCLYAPAAIERDTDSPTVPLSIPDFPTAAEIAGVATNAQAAADSAEAAEGHATAAQNAAGTAAADTAAALAATFAAAQTAAENAAGAAAASAAAAADAIAEIYEDTVAGDAVPLTLTGKGYYVRISADGTTAGVTEDGATPIAWQTGDIGVYQGTSGIYRRIPGGASGSTDAADVSFTPTGGIESTNVADALAELDSDKAAASHASRHRSGGEDAIKLDDLAAPDDNTDLNASTTSHGLAPKATAPATGNRNVHCIDNAETARKDAALFDATNPAALGTASPGTSLFAARRDHVHPAPAEPETIILACSDETTALTAGTAKVTFRMPFAWANLAVEANVTTAPAGGALTVDVNVAGSSILSTKLTIDAGETSSATAATAAVLTTTTIAAGAVVTVDIDGVGATTPGAGLKVTLTGTRG